MLTQPEPDADDSMGDMPDDESNGEPETATVPIDFCGATPPSIGDMISVKVVAVDPDNGNITITCAPNKPMPARGIKAAVAAMKGA